MNWQKLRLYLLIVTCGGVGLALMKLAIAPQSDPARSFVFPSTVPLSTGVLLAQQSLKQPPSRQPTSTLPQVMGHQYRYQVDNYVVNMHMRYFTNTDGNVAVYLQSTLQPSSQLPSLALRHQAAVGNYGLLLYQQHAYLTTCINAQGENSVTRAQFIQNRQVHDLRSDRFLRWLLGQVDLRDWRCLWVLLSTPVGQASPELAYQRLEKNWAAWYPWWRSQFP